MHLEYKNILIRNAECADAPQLCQWWNDGTVMAHAGFPKGLGTTEARIREQIRQESDDTIRRHIICLDGQPIGEMNYRNQGNGVCEMGIKICRADQQNKGLGKRILSLFIQGLFREQGYQIIRLDTNLLNTRAQHVYEQLGFRRLRVNPDAWTDQLGRPQTSVDYELVESDFISYLDSPEQQ